MHTFPFNVHLHIPNVHLLLQSTQGLKFIREWHDLIVAETAVEMRNFGLAPEDWPEDEEAEE